MAKAMSPDAIREQSSQNMGEMSRLIDNLYGRARTEEERKTLSVLSQSIKSIRPKGIVVPQALDVEEQLRKVLREYNSNFDENKSEGVDRATLDIINKIVSTRQKMCDCTMDMDEKRGLKSYLKAHKGAGSKKELKEAYKKAFASAKEESDNYVRQAQALAQKVGSYKQQMGGFQRESMEKEVQARLSKAQADFAALGAQFKKSTDRNEQARLNRKGAILKKQISSLQAALTRIQMVSDQEEYTDVEALHANLGEQLQQTRTYDEKQRQQFQNQVKEDLRSERKADERFMEDTEAMDSEFDKLTNYMENTSGGNVFGDMDDSIFGSVADSSSEAEDDSEFSFG